METQEVAQKTPVPIAKPAPVANPNPNPNQLNIQAEMSKIRQMYADDATTDTFNALILGESGSGKSFLLRTCVGPVHIDSFDPGGSKGLRDEIKSGKIICDARYEHEDPLKPTAFVLWEKEMDRRIKMGYFDQIGTYCLDSATTWSAAIMNAILNKAGLAGTAPRFTKDYGPQKIIIQNWIKRILSLPCHVILTGHLKQIVGEEGTKPTYRFMTTGQAAVSLPLLFDELYVMEPKESSSGVQYRILTQATGTFVARSRLAANGKFAKYEEADIKALLKKAGLSTDDKNQFEETMPNTRRKSLDLARIKN